MGLHYQDGIVRFVHTVLKDKITEVLLGRHDENYEKLFHF